MDCKDIDGLLTAYLEGEVTPEEEGQVEKHLADCPRCRGELESLAASRDKLCRLLKIEASRTEPTPGSWEKIAGKAGIKRGDEKPAAGRSGGAWLAVPVCAALLAMLALGLLGLFGV